MLDTYRYLVKALFGQDHEVRPSNRRLTDALAPKKMRQVLREGGRAATELGLTAGLLSELSLRLPGDRFLAGAAGAPLWELGDEDQVVGAVSSGWLLDADRWPTRIAWHRAAYARSASMAVLLCQPAYVMLLANDESRPDPALLPEASGRVGGLGEADPEDDAVASAIQNFPTVFIQGAGLLVRSTSIGGLLALAETIERWSQLTWLNREMADRRRADL